ncbi:MAG: hypothetical protein IPK15_17410 [Verrucomicrobia bacterium]|jgi:hypothetical protein|nr:hypothetical protein [Verrucomicrobiota bacterium]
MVYVIGVNGFCRRHSDYYFAYHRIRGEHNKRFQGSKSVFHSVRHPISRPAKATVEKVDWHGREEASAANRRCAGVTEILMPPALMAHIESLPSSDDPKAPLHPRAYAIIAKHGRSGMLSNQFAAILADAGLIPPRTHAPKEDGIGR